MSPILTASVKFKPGEPNEIIFHFDDMYRKPKAWTMMRMCNLQYVIEHGTLILKHTKSRCLYLQDLSKIKELAAMSDAEKQQIIMQISSVQTELKMAMDERDTSLKQTTDNKIEELQKELELESEQRNSNELEIRNRLEAESTKLKLYSDESIEAARKLNLKTHIQSAHEKFVRRVGFRV